MEISQDNTAMLPPGDFEKLSKREREEFHLMQEKMVQQLIRGSNDFQLQFPSLHIEWRFQMDVYSSVQSKTSTLHYSDRVF